MTPTTFARNVPSVFLLALFAGCGSPVPSASVPVVQAAQKEVVRAARQPLLYASSLRQSVYFFSYPAGVQQGQLTGFARDFEVGGLCTDEAGDVFVTGTLFGRHKEPGQIYEFKHGATTPIALLKEEYDAVACGVDPSTGNLAVVSANGHSWKDVVGTVAVFTKATGEPKYYVDDQQRFAYCAYDDAGNLFITTTFIGLEELAKGSKSFKKITLPAKTIPRSLQWYNGKLAMSAFASHTHGPTHIYHVTIANGVATIHHEVTLTNSSRNPSPGQFWIDADHVVGAGHELNGLYMWNYPAGGNPAKSLGNGGWPGVTVSR